MKRIVLAVLAVFFGSSMFAYDIAAASQINGSVRQMTRTDFTIVSKFGDYFRTPDVKTVYTFNEAGHVAESSQLTSRDVLMNRIANTYDEDGRLVAETCFDADNAQIWNTVFTYKDGKPADCSEYLHDNVLKGRTIYTYLDGNSTDESYYDGDGAIVWKTVSKYNNAGRLETVTDYFSDGSFDMEQRYEYTPAGKIDSISYFDKNGVLVSKEVFRYDDRGVLAEVTEYNSENRVVRRTLARYGSDGNLAKITVYTVARKFGTTVNEMTAMTDFAYEY